MCQLLGLSSYKPISMQFSLSGFWLRGGGTDEHADGWGIARFHGRQLFVHREMEAAANSSRAHEHDITHVKANTLIAHIRKATQGTIRLENNHPFVYNLWGEQWAFAHNGNLVNYYPSLDCPYTPIGETDSERAFLWLVQNLLSTFPQKPQMSEIHQLLCELSGPIASHGTFNFLLTNGEWLFAHCTTDLSYVQRQAPFCKVRLKDQNLDINFAELNHLDDRFVIIATHPLTDGEQWYKFKKHQLLAFSRGDCLLDGCSNAQAAILQELPLLQFAI